MVMPHFRITNELSQRMVRVFSNNSGSGGGSKKQIEAKALLFWKVESEMNVDRCSGKPDTADLEVLSSASFVFCSR